MKLPLSAALLVAAVTALPAISADYDDIEENVLASAALASERETLQAFYEELGGAHWHRVDAWLTEAPLGDWYGVDVVGGHVVALRLADNNLAGEFPDSLAELGRLKHLDLRWNAITGAIPANVGEMSALNTLLLTSNNLSGAVPDQLGSMSSLNRLDLSHNRLTGEIPPQLGKLKSLQSIGLQNNDLVGSIPSSLGGIDSLRRAVLNNNQLYGSIPISFVEKDGLHLQVQGNLLNDPVPVSAKGRVKAVNNQRSRSLNGTDVLDRTTQVMGSGAAVEFISDVLRAIEVRDGYLLLHDKILPRGANPERMGALIDGMNRRLAEKGETINSINDLERVFELYSPETMEVPSRDSWDFRPGKNARPPQSGRNPNVREPIGYANCDDLRPHHVHLSRQRDGTYKLKSKFSGNCRVIYGPTDISYTLHVSIGKRKTFLWWEWWENLETTVHSRGPEDPARWSHRTAYAEIDCPNDGRFRTQGTLYVSSASLGDYYPHPGYRAGDDRRLEC